MSQQPPYNQQPNGNNQQQPYYPQHPNQPPPWQPQPSYYPPGYQPAILPPPPPKQRKSPKHVWRNAGKGGKCGIIAACLIVPLSLCICISVATASTNNGAATPIATTIAQRPTVRVTTKPTAASAIAPTKIPTPRPTKAPTPTPAPPTATPTQPPAPTTAPTGVNGNPWGYNFVAGNYIYSPNAAFCDYFTCVSTFWTKTNGYVAECYNGSYTHSGGVSGACSRDGGVEQALYSH